MKLFRKSKLIISILMIIFFSSPFSTYAQGIGSDPCDYQDPMIPCPIDDGVIALLVIGVVYGMKKVKDFRKETSTTDSL